MHTSRPTSTPAPAPAPVDDPAVRATLVVGLLGTALVHVIDGIGKWSEVRYEFWLFMALVVGCVALAGGFLFTRSRLLLPATLGLIVPAFIAYVLSRTTGLPQSTDDIGNWTEPIGVVNVFVELAVLAVAAPALALGRSRSRSNARAAVLATAPAR
ncbi:MAG: hypothetical protein PGN13_02435 [Patulibacter minatonensis]